MVGGVAVALGRITEVGPPTADRTRTPHPAGSPPSA